MTEHEHISATQLPKHRLQPAQPRGLLKYSTDPSWISSWGRALPGVDLGTGAELRGRGDGDDGSVSSAAGGQGADHAFSPHAWGQLKYPASRPTELASVDFGIPRSAGFVRI